VTENQIDEIARKVVSAANELSMSIGHAYNLTSSGDLPSPLEVASSH
jgi:hypothetical protein